MRHIGLIAAELRRRCGVPTTKKEIMAELRGVDGLRAKAATEYLPAVQREQARQGTARKARGDWSRYRTPDKFIAPWKRGTLDERLCKRAAASFPRLMKFGAAGGGSIRFGLTALPAEVGYQVSMSSNRDTYAKSSKWGHAEAAEDHHYITLPRAYMSRVVRRGLAVVDGMPTLDAAILDAPEGVELYAARWARQGRGYKVETDTGYIARSGRNTYHAATVAAALRGLQRKTDGVKLTGPTMARLAELHGSAWVPLAAVRAVGACDYGIRSWVERTGMRAQYEAGGATVAEVAAGYAVCPAPEARAAVLYAIRQARRAA